MILIVTPASEINKAKKTKVVIMVFFGPDVGFVKPLPAAFSCHCFRAPAQYRHTESLIRIHALMEDSSVQLRRDAGSVCPRLSSPLPHGMFPMLRAPQLPKVR